MLPGEIGSSRLGLPRGRSTGSRPRLESRPPGTSGAGRTAGTGATTGVVKGTRDVSVMSGGALSSGGVDLLLQIPESTEDRAGE